MHASSQDLHPTNGARFVFEREADDASGPVYRVTIYMPAQRSWVGRLSWPDGAATLSADAGHDAPGHDAPGHDEALGWAHAEALKLARTLRRTPKQHMVRWRG
jgi:hypothetical protein